MRIKKLGDILNKEQIKKVFEIVDTCNSDDVLSKLKIYFKKIEKELNDKDIHHEYLAWVVYAKLLKI
jgi:hypothetical protein